MLVVVGTRPEAIKLAPVVRELRQRGTAAGIGTTVLVTGQHPEMARDSLADFGIEPDVDLGPPSGSLSLSAMTSHVMAGLEGWIGDADRPPIAHVVVQGDTTSVLAAALWAFYRRLPISHVEAGLRTPSLEEPFPEEGNRRLVSQIATLHFAPTGGAVENLRRSGVEAGIELTGNTVVDALLWMARTARPPQIPGLDWSRRRVLLATVHRRESRGERLQAILDGLIALVEEHDDVAVVLPVHPHPEIAGPVRRRLEGRERVHLTAPLAYRDFVGALKSCHLVLTDSGGVQEEAPSLDRPVLVLRERTERPEAVASGAARVVGAQRQAIVHHARELLRDEAAYARMAQAANPFGDGHAAERLARRILEHVLEASTPGPA